jgi:organic radical activating enzyme
MNNIKDNSNNGFNHYKDDGLVNKIRGFLDKRPQLLDNYADFHFEDALVRIPIETKDEHVIESTFCYGYGREKYLAAVSVQVGCATKCTFCDLGYTGLKRNLTDSEILEELNIVLNTAKKRGYDIFSRPLKASFVMGGDPLMNKYFPKVIERMNEEIPLQLKISTIFPDSKKSLEIYDAIVEASSNYTNIIQPQISLNATDEKSRQSFSKISLAGFKKIRNAAESWYKDVNNDRKMTLTFTLNADSAANPYDIKDILSPDLFNIRLRICLPTSQGYKNGISFITKNKVDVLQSKFIDAGYSFIPGMPYDVEERFKLAPGESINIYNALKNK